MKKIVFVFPALVIALFLFINTGKLSNVYADYCANQRRINQWSCQDKSRYFDVCLYGDAWMCNWSCPCVKWMTWKACVVIRKDVPCQSNPCRTVQKENDCSSGASYRSSCYTYNSEYKGCWVLTPCSCSAWTNQSCGGGSCNPNRMRQTRNCPNNCDIESRCVSNSLCDPPPTCTVDLTPVNASFSVGTSIDFTASVVPTNGTVDKVNFSSSDTGVATVNPASDSVAIYQTEATGQSAGTLVITADVIMGGASRCTDDTSTLEVILPGPWWQVQDADIITNGNLFSLIPATTCLLPGCDPAFGLEGPGGYPGVPSYGGSYDFEMGSGTGTVSSTGWLANSTTTLNKVYDYSYFEGLVRPDVEINEIIEPEIQGGYLIFQGNATRDYVWFKKQGDLTITGTANLQDRKVVLLVDGDLYLGRPPAQSGSKIWVRDGSGFFMAIVSGDIIISPKASIDPLNPAPVFEGIFLAEGQVKTGTEGPELDEQLWIRGSVAAYGGVVLERDLTDNSLTPAEFFEYGPDLLFTFPRDLTSRRYKWKEIAP